MAHTTIWSPKLFFYPVGNTPAGSLTESIPPDVDAAILSLGCGDPRSTLYTLFLDEKNTFHRRLDFTFCDAEPAILARNILIYTLLFDQCDSKVIKHVWNIYCDIFTDKSAFDLVVAQCTKLLDLSTSMERWEAHQYGTFIGFCTLDSMIAIRQFWRRYLCKGRDMVALKGRVLKEMGKVYDERVGGALVTAAVRSAGIMASEMGLFAPSHFTHYWKCGVTGVDAKELQDATHVNPTLLLSSYGDSFNVHYGTDPIKCFHLAPSLESLSYEHDNPPTPSVTAASIVANVKDQFAGWCVGFHRRMHARSPNAEVRFRFFGGNAMGLCKALLSVSRGAPLNTTEHADVWGATTISFVNDYQQNSSSPAPLNFNVIDTSNLADHIGYLNILLVAAPLLRRDSPAVLFTHCLVSSINQRHEHIAALDTIGVDLPLLSTVLGLVPERKYSDFTSQSMSPELFLSAFQRGASFQFLELNSWQAISGPQAPAGHTFNCNAPKFGAFLFSIYLKLFRDESFFNALGGSTCPKHYTRDTFVSLLSYVKERYVGKWASVMDHVLNSIKADRTLMVGLNYYQDLSRGLQLAGLADVVTVPRSPSLPMASLNPCFPGWQDIPITIYIVLVVPRPVIQRILDETKEMSTPCMQCEVLCPRGHNAFASIQPTFGSIEGGGTSPGRTGVIYEDPKRWSGTSDLIVYFPCPAWIFSEWQLNSCAVSLNMCGMVGAVIFTSILGPNLKVWSTTLADSKRAFILRDPPRVASQATSQHGSISTSLTAVTPTPRPSTEPHPVVVNIENGIVASFTIRTMIVDKVAKESLAASGTRVKTRAMSISTVHISFPRFEATLHFPYPIDVTTLITRIARKSSYVEIEARIAHATKTSPGLNPFPVLPSGVGGVWASSMHYLTLDALPSLRRPMDPTATWRWLRPHFGLSLEEELRRSRASAGAKKYGLSELKDTLFSLFVGVAEKHYGMPTLVELCRPEVDGICILLFVDRLRIDLTGNTIIADASVLVLTPSLLKIPAIRAALSVSRLTLQINLVREEIGWWSAYLPTAVERCRTWKHMGKCEYVTNGVPRSLDLREDPICTCGRGKNLGGFANVKEWGLFTPFVTRVALGMPFPTSSLVDLASSVQRRFTATSPAFSGLGSDRTRPSFLEVVCAGCGQPGEPALQACSACKIVRYCSSTCQKADWKRHKLACSRM